tara:strand:- start:563 stop:1321 length:759 start_codon:yes stop_codon:yes gene_type:complete
MNYIKIEAILIKKTNIKTCFELEKSHIISVFEEYFGTDLVNNIKIPEHKTKKFPILVEFKEVEINTYLTQNILSKIYDFNIFLKENGSMKMKVGANEIWTIERRSIIEIIGRLQKQNDIKIIKNKKDEYDILLERIKSHTDELQYESIESRLNIVQTFMNMLMIRNKFEIAEMLGGILDENDYFVSKPNQSSEQYKNYIVRKSKYYHLTIESMNCIEDNLIRLQNQPLELKRHCVDDETFERLHGISFNESY